MAEVLPSGGEVGPGVPPFSVRPGYRVTLAAEKMGETRFLEFDDKGTLYLSQPATGSILALRDTDGDGVYETRTPFVTGKKTVHGMCFKDGWLWFTQSGSVSKARDGNGDGVADEIVTVLDGLPSGGGHWWRSILVTDDGFYTSIGDPENASDQTATDREKIWHYDLQGKNKKLFASGIRNTEKLRFRPGTNEVWGADHGSDNFGGPLGEKGRNQPITDLIPPCEFNHYVQDGFYGHPFLIGNRIPRIEFQNRPDILDLAAKTIPPAWSFGAHWASNGFTFLSKGAFPSHQGDVFAALHGSWNSSVKVGYRVERILFDSVTGQPYGAQCIVSTLSPNGNDVLDRPVDCAEAPDGSILFSCDGKKRIYRISWIGNPAPASTPAAAPTRAVSASTPDSSPAVSAMPDLAPIAYFNASCARCHGPFGSFYGQRPYHPWEELRTNIKRMAEGPGNAPLSDKGLDAQTAYHQSLYDLKPFVAWIGRNGQTISGEVSPGSTVTVLIGSKTIAAQVQDYRWSATLPAGVEPTQVQLSAQNDKGETILALKESSFSHFKPELPIKSGN